MEVRDATPADADRLAALVDAEFDPSRLIRERTVLVAEDDDQVVGFLSYDVWSETVHVSTMVGDPPVVDELLAEPRSLADREAIPVEIVVPDHDDELRSIVRDAGFERVGRGPLFDGEPSHRYRYND
ncbi:MAG: N-acetyltransferase family protein [Halanaeroarchaeum sp.]